MPKIESSLHRLFLLGGMLITLLPAMVTAQTSGKQTDPKREAYSDGLFFMLMGKYDSAVYRMDQAIKEYPEHSDFYEMRGRCKSVLKDHEGGLQDLITATELNPDNATHHYYKGEIQTYLKDYEGSLESHNRGVELDPDFEFGLFFRGRTHVLMGNFELALADLNRAAEIAPRHGMIYKYRGMAKLRLYGPEEGCPDLLTAKTKGAQYVDEIIGDYCNDLYGGDVLPAGDGWEVYKNPKDYDAMNAGNVDSWENTPESIVTYFYASKVREDEKWKKVCQDESQWTDRMKFSLRKYEKWNFKRFHLVSRKLVSPGKYWVKLYFDISITHDGRTIEDGGEDEATVELINGKWTITEVPN